jgi:hypothetical protein
VCVESGHGDELVIPFLFPFLLRLSFLSDDKEKGFRYSHYKISVQTTQSNSMIFSYALAANPPHAVDCLQGAIRHYVRSSAENDPLDLVERIRGQPLSAGESYVYSSHMQDATSASTARLRWLLSEQCSMGLSFESIHQSHECMYSDSSSNRAIRLSRFDAHGYSTDDTIGVLLSETLLSQHALGPCSLVISRCPSPNKLQRLGRD